MDLHTLLMGIIAGFTLAIPIGPIGILCIRKTLSEGLFPGLIIGLGAASVDFLYSGVASFGLTVISDTINNQKILVKILGGVLFLILGLKILYNQHSTFNTSNKRVGKLKSYISTFLITLANPLTIFAFLTFFAILGLSIELSYFDSIVLSLGVFIGSITWFFLLSSNIVYFRRKINLNQMFWVNRISGSFIIASGVVLIISLF